MLRTVINGLARQKSARHVALGELIALPIALLITLAFALPLMLTGCADAVTPTLKSTASPSVPADPALKSVFPDNFTADVAKLETVRLADEIVGLLPNSIVVHVDSRDQLVAATADTASYYGVLRIISLDPQHDPVAISKTMVQKLEASGWSQRQSTDDASGVHVVTLSSNKKPNISWLLQLSGDPRVAGQSVIQLQLGSPDLR